MFQEKIKQTTQSMKKALIETFKLLWQFKWYIIIYMCFYALLLLNYSMPSPKNYFLWYDWCAYDQQIYLGTTRLLLIIFALLFFIATSNMRNHPLLAKLIFLSSLWFITVFLE